jgi:vacuolar-type H+-ATPase catalytic subunit A/Vma1
MSITNNLYQNMNAAYKSSTESSDGSWFEAMAEAWGEALDRQANKIETMSTEIGDQGNETPSAITRLTAESLKMTFLSNSSHTALSSMGSSLETMARKQ